MTTSCTFCPNPHGVLKIVLMICCIHIPLLLAFHQTRQYKLNAPPPANLGALGLREEIAFILRKATREKECGPPMALADPAYFASVHMDPGVRGRSYFRKKLFDWIFTACDHLRLSNQAVLLSLNYCDRLLGSGPVPEPQLQVFSHKHIVTECIFVCMF